MTLEQFLQFLSGSLETIKFQESWLETGKASKYQEVDEVVGYICEEARKLEWNCDVFLHREKEQEQA